MLITDLMWSRRHAGESLARKKIKSLQLASKFLDDHWLALIAAMERHP
jgi:hypothetical protein